MQVSCSSVTFIVVDGGGVSSDGRHRYGRGVNIAAVHQDHLADLQAAGRLRTLSARQGLDFASNDYLGLAGSAVLRAAVAEALGRGVPVGSGGSRLLRGNHPEHEALEAEAATLFGSAAALYFSSGYAANAALLATLPQRGDLVVHDALIHASAHEGMRLGRAQTMSVAHNEAGAFETAIAGWRAGGWHGPRLDRGRESVLHGRGPGTARRSDGRR